jgi:sugar lactone lactonase YvrE
MRGRNMEEKHNMKKPRSTLVPRIASLLLIAGLSACATAPDGTAPVSNAVFYPPLPNPPRIQHLVTFTGERDVNGPTDAFTKFVVGEDKKTQALKQPYGVGLFEGKLYVADSRAPGLAIFDLKQRRFSLVSGGGNGRMKRPINVTIDNDGTKYVADTGRNQVLVYDRDDRFVSAYGTEKQFKPVDTAILGEKLFVVDVEHHLVQVLDKRSGELLFKFGKPGSGTSDLFQPTNIAVGPNGDIYVVDTGNFRVQQFTADGTHVRVYGEVGSAPGKFARPKGIAVDREGRLYIGDAAFENVQVFDRSGRLLLYFGQPGGNAEGLNLPAGVAIDYDNVEWFRRYADPNFAIEYLIVVASQFGPNKVDVFAFGRMRGMKYSDNNAEAVRQLN